MNEELKDKLSQIDFDLADEVENEVSRAYKEAMQLGIAKGIEKSYTIEDIDFTIVQNVADKVYELKQSGRNYTDNEIYDLRRDIAVDTFQTVDELLFIAANHVTKTEFEYDQSEDKLKQKFAETYQRLTRENELEMSMSVAKDYYYRIVEADAEYMKFSEERNRLKKVSREAKEIYWTLKKRIDILEQVLITMGKKDF